jgi:hypothetical protein
MLLWNQPSSLSDHLYRLRAITECVPPVFMQSDHGIGLDVFGPRFNPGRQASNSSICPIMMLLVFPPIKEETTVIPFRGYQLD